MKKIIQKHSKTLIHRPHNRQTSRTDNDSGQNTYEHTFQSHETVSGVVEKQNVNVKKQIMWHIAYATIPHYYNIYFSKSSSFLV